MFAKNRYNQCCAAVMVALSLQSVPAKAQGIDPLIEGAKLCTRYLQHYETQYGIPAHLLSAIASTESGRYHKDLKISLPWPWTINAEGKGYYLNSKEEAMAKAHSLYNQGVRSMDVGCMQVNLHHHADAFASLSDAFEPEKNVAYAAKFLRTLYQEDGSWKVAASHYHSKTPHLGKKYVGRVYDSWFNIVDKLHAARISVPANSVNALNEMKQQVASADSVAPITPKPVAKFISVTNDSPKDISAYKSANSKTIKVTSDGGVNNPKKRDNGIIIVRPEIKVVSDGDYLAKKNQAPEPMIMADARSVHNSSNSLLDLAPSSGGQLAEKNMITPQSQAKIVRLDNKLVDRRPVNNEIVTKKSGPNFIFND